jgi:hypothetical protein
MGPVVDKPLNTRAQLNQHRRTDDPDPPIATGAHYTLTYNQGNTGEEHYSSITEILQWIATGPLLPPPVTSCPPPRNITMPPPGTAPISASDAAPRTTGTTSGLGPRTGHHTREQRVRSQQTNGPPLRAPNQTDDASPTAARDLRRRHRTNEAKTEVPPATRHTPHNKGWAHLPRDGARATWPIGPRASM